MLTEQQIQFIKQYVDVKYFDVEKIIAYLKIHDVVGDEIFELALKKDCNRNIRMLNGRCGYEPISKDLFIKRIPFFFYEADFDKGQHGGLDDLIYGLYRKASEKDNWRIVYEKLERLFYHHHLTIPELMGYIVVQTGVVSRTDLFLQWADYVDLCEKIHSDDYYPQSFIYSNNVVREKCGLEPIIYEPGLVGFNENFLRRGNEIIIGGEFPCDENGNPEMRWIALWIEDAKYITASDTFSMTNTKTIDKELHIGLTPTTKIYMPNIYNNKDETEDVWYPIYSGPLAMEFDSNTLKYYRSYAKYTQQQVADAIGVQVRTYQKWEGGETIPDGYNLIRIMNLLDIPSVQEFVKAPPFEDTGFKLFKSKTTNTIAK